MLTCAHCGALSCLKEDKSAMPANCPIRQKEVMDACLEKYQNDETLPFFQAAAAIEAEGYCEWPRLREIGEFCRKMGYRRIGVAFCVGLGKEAKIVVDILKKFDLEVESIACKTGGYGKKELGIAPEHYVKKGAFEAMCNPIAQAEFLNRAGCEFNVAVGLCVGHDSLFFKRSDAPVTVLIAKDRALAHNPAGALYCAEGYMKKKLTPRTMQ